MAVAAPFKEAYDNGPSCTPTVVEIVDTLQNDRLICKGLLLPGQRKMGPAMWAHQSDTSSWVAHGVAYISVVNDNRTEARVVMRPVEFTYVDRDGWYTKYRCPQNR